MQDAQALLNAALDAEPDGGPEIAEAIPRRSIDEETLPKKSLFDIPDTVEEAAPGQTPVGGNPDAPVVPAEGDPGTAAEVAPEAFITYPIEYELADGTAHTIDSAEDHAALLQAGHNPAAAMTAAHRRNRDNRLEAQEKLAYETQITELQSKIAASAPDAFESLPPKVTPADWNALAALNIAGSNTYNPAEHARKYAELQKRETDRDRAIIQSARDAGKATTEVNATKALSPKEHADMLMATAAEAEKTNPAPEGKEEAFLAEFERLCTVEFGEAGVSAMNARDVRYLMAEARRTVTSVTDPAAANQTAAQAQSRAIVRAVAVAPKEIPTSNARPDQTTVITDGMVDLASNPELHAKFMAQSIRDGKLEEFVSGKYVPEIST